MKFAEILPFIYTDTLTYSIPRSQAAKIEIGQLVEIPFGKRKTKGIVFEITTKKPHFSTKEILNIVNVEPILTKNQIELAKWLSLYYFSSPYQVLKNIKVLGIEKIANQNKKIRRKLLEKKSGDYKKKRFILFGNESKKLYLKIVRRFLGKKKQVLILFPDNLKLDDFFAKYKKDLKKIKFSIISSKLKTKERINEWLKIKNNESQLIIGTRSAIFSPFRNLGLIMIDNEYEDGYRQEKNPRYDTREVAEFLQKITNCTLVLESDIPTLENYFRLQNGYRTIKSKVGESKRKITVIEENRFSVLGEKIEESIRKNLKKKKQTAIFLNRKGQDTFMICGDCNYVLTCPNCEVSLISSGDFVFCNHCGFRESIPSTCEKCQSPIIKKLGMGTEKLEKEIKSLFPESKIIRIDESTKRTVSKKTVKEAEIIIGTKMIKNIPFKRIGLLIFLSIDNLLNLPTYKASQNTQKILSSLISKTLKGTLITVKTSNPENELIKAIKNNNYLHFFKKELLSLKKLHYPPFFDLLQIVVSGKNEKLIEKEALKIKEGFKNFEIIGPFAPLVTKKFDDMKLILILKTKKNTVFYDKIFKSRDILITRNPESLL